MGEESAKLTGPSRSSGGAISPRILAIGGAVALASLPIAYFTSGWTALPLALGSFLLGAAAMVGAHVADRWTHRHITSWGTELASKTATEPVRGRGGGLIDTQAYLNGLTESIEARLEHLTRNQRDAFIAMITSLVSVLEARDPYTRNHSSRVATLSVRLGKKIGLGDADLYTLHLSGLLHDLGKIGIPDAILLKPGGLTKEEYEIMKGHTELGAKILGRLPGLEEVALIVRHHHEMYDGRGYPEALKGGDIPLGARIVAITDTYLSMAEDRPYRSGRSLGKTIAEMRRVGGHQLDPSLLEAFFELLMEDQENGRLYVNPAESSTRAA